LANLEIRIAVPLQQLPKSANIPCPSLDWPTPKMAPFCVFAAGSQTLNPGIADPVSGHLILTPADSYF
jgi:hypothetical protein